MIPLRSVISFEVVKPSKTDVALPERFPTIFSENVFIPLIVWFPDNRVILSDKSFILIMLLDVISIP